MPRGREVSCLIRYLVKSSLGSGTRGGLHEAVSTSMEAQTGPYKDF